MTGLARLRRDEGRISVYFAVALTAIVVLIGLTVDGSGRFRMMQRADNIAAEAAGPAGRPSTPGRGTRGYGPV